MIERLTTGIKDFDQLVEGGIPKGHLILVSGMPGTGKSIFCSQIMFHNALSGKKCLYLNLEQDNGRLEVQMKELGLDPEKVKKNLKIVSIDSTDSDVVDYILQEIQGLKYDLIVLDSLDSISSVPLAATDANAMGIQKVAENLIPTVFDQPMIGRLKLKKIFTAIAKSGATAFLTSERVDNMPGITRDTISEFLCDGIILMHYLGVGSEEFRSMQITKMRLTGHEKGTILFEISKSGVVLKKENPI
jgi:circadian clock protein KaiC